MSRTVIDGVAVVHVNATRTAAVAPRVLRAVQSGAPYWAYFAGYAGNRGWRYILPLGRDFAKPVLRLIREVRNGELVMSCGHTASRVGAGGRSHLGDEVVCFDCQRAAGGWPDAPYQLIALERGEEHLRDARGQRRYLLGRAQGEGINGAVLLCTPFALPAARAAALEGRFLTFETEGDLRMLACGYEPPPGSAPHPMLLLTGEGTLRWYVARQPIGAQHFRLACRPEDDNLVEMALEEVDVSGV